jgi:hypothetical protein
LAVKFVLLGTLKDCSGENEVEARSHTLEEELEPPSDTPPALRDNICDEHGRVRELVNVFVGGKAMRSLSGEEPRLGRRKGLRNAFGRRGDCMSMQGRRSS